MPWSSSDGPHVVLEDAGVLLHQLVREPGDALDQLTWLEPGGGAHGEAGRDAPLEAGDAHHEVLVEVVGEDREEAGALEQRHGGSMASWSTRSLNCSQDSSRSR